MAKIEFNVQYRPKIESGEYKVETRDGRPARIICWDMKSKNGSTIVALVNDGTYELCYYFKNTGRFMNSGKDNGADLFIITSDPELTEFEEEIRRVSNFDLNYEMKEEIRATAAHVLNLARKQIEAEKKLFKRLPTIEEWGWLINNCEWKWDENRKGQVVTEPNGNSIFLPAAGYRSDNCLCFVGSYGYYWSSSHDAYIVNFSSGDVGWYSGNRCYGRSVLPVSDTPMEGFVDMGNGLFWAENNEEGYFTYDEAMKLFNDAR